MKWLLVALSAMFVQQTFAALGKILPAVIAPAIVADLGIDPAWLGVYVGLMALSALLFQLGCGSFVLRYGPLRMSQAALLMLGLSMAATVPGLLILFAISAIIGGGGAAISTPASSHLLGRYSPPRYLPLVFSIKQTAVPAGLLLAGVLGPLLTGMIGWRGAMLSSAAACIVFAAMLEPLHREFDSDRVPTRSFQFSDFKHTLDAVTGRRDLRALCFTCFAFNGLQTVFSAYFVVYMVSLGHSLAAAGLAFSVAMAVAVPGRIVWGWIASRLDTPRLVMVSLAFGMAMAALACGFFSAAWPLWAVGLVATVMSATALSWNGVLLAEAARLAPDGMTAPVTGGVLSFGQLGALVLPLAYSALLGLTGSHGIGFIVGGLPALLVGIDMLRRSAAAAEEEPS